MSTNNKTTGHELSQKRANVSKLLESYKPHFQNALPSFITPEKMIRVALTAMSKQPSLFECTQVSLLGCLLTSAQLGLIPDGVLGEAYLIPYKNTKKNITECTLIVGYRGYCSLAYRSSMVQSVQAHEVRVGDVFTYEFGLNPSMVHKPKGSSGEITHFYCVVQLKTGGSIFEVMTAEEVNFIRDQSPNYAYSRNKESTIWFKHYPEMGKKTVIRKLMKITPLSSEIQRAVGLDEAADFSSDGQQIYTELLSAESVEQDDVDSALNQLGESHESNELEQSQQKEMSIIEKSKAAAAAEMTRMEGEMKK